MVKDEYTNTLYHEAGHVVAAYYFSPGSEPDTMVTSDSTGQTTFNTIEDPAVSAQVCMAGVVSTKMFLKEPRKLTPITVMEVGGMADIEVIDEFLGDRSLPAFKAFADEVEGMLVPYKGQIQKVVDAMRAHEGKLTIEQVEEVLK
jgi:hypothetical protein